MIYRDNDVDKDGYRDKYKDECKYNMVELCLVKIGYKQSTALNRTVCMFETSQAKVEKMDDAYKKCYPAINYYQVLFQYCQIYDNVRYFKEAIAATPAHDSIPWAVVEGNELTTADRNMINNNVFKWACDNYKGKKPENCDKTLATLSLLEK